MNFIVISPHFPANFEQFSVSLSNNGITTLGIGDKAYDELTPSLCAPRCMSTTESMIWKIMTKCIEQ